MIGSVAAANALPGQLQPAVILDMRGRPTGKSATLRPLPGTVVAQVAIGHISQKPLEGIRTITRHLDAISAALARGRPVAFLCEAGHHRANGGAAFGLMCISYLCGMPLTTHRCMNLIAAVHPLPLGFHSHMTRFYQRLESFRVHLCNHGASGFASWTDPGDRNSSIDSTFFQHSGVLPGRRWLLCNDVLCPAVTDQLPRELNVFSSQGRFTKMPWGSVPGVIQHGSGRLPVTEWSCKSGDPIRLFDVRDNSAVSFRLCISDEVATSMDGKPVAFHLLRI